MGPTPPSISLPKGGGAIRGMGEKFGANPVTGTGNLSVPLATSPGRAGFGPSLALQYDSGAGNGPFGFGWSVAMPAITRKTDKGLPRYDSEPEDTFVLSGAEDLVPVLEEHAGHWSPAESHRTVDGRDYVVQRYRPRVEGLFARIERWTDLESGASHWRSITPANVTTVYGASTDSRISDPHDATRVFSWLICQSYDDTGNAMVYEYKADDGEGVDTQAVHEQGRTADARTANRYLKRIRYGNRVSRLVEPDLSQAEWLFEVVLDYGEHNPDTPSAQEASPWAVRADPFSSYRSGFEVRTYRLCRRVLMFHHFPDEEGVGADCLVRSTDLSYRSDPVASFVESAVQSGYRRRPDGTYLRKSLPPLEFAFSKAEISSEVRTVDPESLENLPYGVDGTTYRWADLDGEGLSGILSEQAAGWYYKANRGGGRFGPSRALTTTPVLPLRAAGTQLLDLAGDGRLDLVDFAGPGPGFYERTDDRGWEPFRPFRLHPEIPLDDPELHFVDLTGDGHADILISGDDVFTWYPSLGEEGFGPASHTYPPIDDDRRPRVLFADTEQSVYLADMSADGLQDLVRIRNGEVCYWPSLGYGRFGARVVMGGSPWFDEPDQFDHRRVRLVDIDGSGTSDIIYLHRDRTRVYPNQAGNSFAPAHELPWAFAGLDTVAEVSTVDLLGNGTACLVWSSPLPSESGRQMRYVDLMGGYKPHLLTEVRNNLGAETRMHYVPSTRFYLADEQAGRPWATRLPFPVHVVESVETLDRISRNRFVTRYAYHHGYFDGTEREFRGFGMVEQWDTEEFAALSARGEATNLDPGTHVPPVLTRTWFHTGAFLDRERISRHLAHEYYREAEHPAGDDLLLQDTVLPDSVRRRGREPAPWRLSPDEVRQACRALKGSVLRQEVYGRDGSEAQHRPYTVSERNYTIEMLQPATPGAHPVFFTHERETITAAYERRLYRVGDGLRADPRVSHELVIAVDDYGNVLRSVAVSYGRRHPDPDPVVTPEDHERQGETHVVLTENRYTNEIEGFDDFRTPNQYETRVFELAGVPPDPGRGGSGWIHTLGALARDVAELPYQAWDQAKARPGGLSKRLIEHRRIRYRRDDLSGPLPRGELQTLALPYETYRLALTTGLSAEVYGDRVEEADLSGPGGYVHEEDDDGWWVPSGRVLYSPVPGADAAAELEHAQHHFFSPALFRNPFGAHITVIRDRYDLLTLEMLDALGSTITAGERAPDGRLVTTGNDYRLLQPRVLTDANGNRAAVAFDALGMIVGTAVMGKLEDHTGDSLAGFDPDPPEALVAAYLRDPLAQPERLLQDASTRLVYDLFAYMRTRAVPEPRPAVVASLARTTHASDLPAGERTDLQHTFSYSDGFAREVQKKAQAEAGPVEEGAADIDPRWIGTGWTVYNNKGKAVRRYEPFFSADQGYESSRSTGASTVFFYDPVERVVATLHADDSWEKVVVDPWQETTWDGNDTVLLHPRTDRDVGGLVACYIAGLEARPEGWATWYAQRADGQLGSEERSAARRAAAHAATPARTCTDALGHTYLRVTHNRFGDDGAAVEQHLVTRIRFDVEGNQKEIRDPLGRSVMRYSHDMLGNAVYQASMESGTRRILTDVGGSPFLTWNSRGQRIRNDYDPLRRPIRQWVRQRDGRETLAERTVYGEAHPQSEARNLRGKTFYQLDGAGAVRHEAHDFKGNLLRSSRRVTRQYRGRASWGELEAQLTAQPLDVDALETALAPVLETTAYDGQTTYDAHDRPATVTAPDGTFIRLTYNVANLLERLDAHVRGADEATRFVTGMTYNSRSQRTAVAYGNGVTVLQSYDPLTFRPRSLKVVRQGVALRDLRYVFDPVGNLLLSSDRARPPVFFDNAAVTADADYVYDAIYQLVTATGREHLGQAGTTRGGSRDGSLPPPAHPDDGQAMRRYRERYQYDTAGNVLAVLHRAAGGDWSRDYRYDEPSQLDAHQSSNRLSATSVRDEVTHLAYDAHGNVTVMAHLRRMEWDHEDQLEVVDRGGGGQVHYQYDSAGRRVRKTVVRQNDTRAEERVYVGGYEVFRSFDGTGEAVALERQTVHILDDQRRIALVETKTVDRDAQSDRSPRLRYQIGDHLGSVGLELDETGRLISFEEYYPYGGTSFLAGRGAAEVSRKRYRYNGKERDEETGLYYYGARYYAPWLARWVSADPAGLVDGSNGYRYVKNNPVNATDPTGMWSTPSWRTVAVIAAVVVVGTIVTVATAGAAGPLVVGAVASIGLTGTAATVATGVAVGAIAGAVGGAAAGAAGEATRQTVNSRALGLGTEEFSGTRVLTAAAEGGESGAKWGAAIGGVTALAATAAGAAAIGVAGKVAQRVVPAGLRAAASSVGSGLGTAVRTVAQRTGLQALARSAEGLGMRAASSVFAEGSAGGQAVARLASTGSVAETFGAAPRAQAPVTAPPSAAQRGESATESAAWAPKGRAAPPTSVKKSDFEDWRATWKDDPHALVVFEAEGAGVKVGDIFRGAQPQGSGGQMLADTLKSAGVPQPATIRPAGIINERVLGELAQGMPPGQTLLGKTVQNAVGELRGTITGWTSGVDRGGPWIQATVKYP